jgi:UDP-N-acetylglucosamine 2-epimerase (non-hydrolysing)
MEHVLLISGTRPEIVKLAPLYHVLRATPDTTVHWLHTGQHGEMAAQILDCFEITPDIVLERQGSSLSEFTIGCRRQLEAVFTGRRWSAAIVQGDTESSLQGELAAYYNHMPVAHVEAGLRTYNLERPFPEEALRQMIGRLTRLHFAPTARAQEALLREGIAAKDVFVTGNTVVDAQQWVCRHKGITRSVNGRGHLLVTVHRREYWGHDVDEICRAIADIASAHPDLDVLFPVHLNPVVRGPVHALLGRLPNVRLCDPLDYLAMQQALADAWLVLTDSGGLQEEAPTFGIPVLVLRHETERPEAVDAGCALLIGTAHRDIVDGVERLWQDANAYARMSMNGNPFGDGSASRLIAATLREYFAAASVSSVAA